MGLILTFEYCYYNKNFLGELVGDLHLVYAGFPMLNVKIFGFIEEKH